MNTNLQLALELLDRSNATYVVTHTSLKAPIFSEDRTKKPVKFVAAVPTKRKYSRRRSAWRALLADLRTGDSKEITPPEGVSAATFQLRASSAMHTYFGKGQSRTKRLANGSVRVTRL